VELDFDPVSGGDGVEQEIILVRCEVDLVETDTTSLLYVNCSYMYQRPRGMS
jgi:hypothetical protein